MITRRALLQRGLAGGLGVALGPRLTPAFGSRPALTPYRDPLTVPAALPPFATSASGAPTEFRVGLAQISRQLHSELPGPADVWAYGGWNGSAVVGASYPGPTLVVRRGVPVTVTYFNRLPAGALFPESDPVILDHLRAGGHAGAIPPVRVNTHLHGGHISAAADGNPHHVPLAHEITPGGSQTMTYANDQRAALAWYHDHAVGITRSNVMSGLAGGYLITDPGDGASGLPEGAFDIPLIIQDRLVDPATGRLVYPGPGLPDGRTWVPEFFGDVVLVNGGIWPHLVVEPRKYRLRVLNGSNARLYNLRFFASVDGALRVHQIGTDLGYLAEPVATRDVLCAPAERCDLIVDFTYLAGQTVELRDMRLPAGVVSPASRLQRAGIMQFRVEGTRVKRPLPTLPAPTPKLTATRRIVRTLEEVMDESNDEPLMALLDGKLFHDPMNAEDRIADGTTVLWEIVNLTADSHPIHLHLVDFEVLDRQSIDVRRYLAALAARREDPAWMDAPHPDPAPYLIGKATRAPATERGPKDTVRADPRLVTRIKATFKVPAGTPLPAKYVWHCHILEHEDNDMMRPYEVV